MIRLSHSILFLCLFSLSTQAQNLLYHENFDAPSFGDSVQFVPGDWDYDTALFVSPENSFWSAVVVGDTLNFVTDTILPDTMNYVLLEFDQICKISFFHAFRVQFKLISDSTWTNVLHQHPTTMDTVYFGSGHYGVNGNKFASNSYSLWQPTNSLAIPQNCLVLK